METGFFLAAVFIAVPWIALHYLTKWKTAAAITADDEDLLEELYRLAKRLEERMDTVERLVADDDPNFRPPRPGELSAREFDHSPVRELEALIEDKKRGRIR